MFSISTSLNLLSTSRHLPVHLPPSNILAYRGPTPHLVSDSASDGDTTLGCVYLRCALVWPWNLRQHGSDQCIARIKPSSSFRYAILLLLGFRVGRAGEVVPRETLCPFGHLILLLLGGCGKGGRGVVMEWVVRRDGALALSSR